MTLNTRHNSLFFKPIDHRPKPLVAISACLNGEAVRYDGSDKYQASIGQYLTGQIDLLPICPEVEAGLGTPRPPVQLVQGENQILAVGRDDSSLDVTEALIKVSQLSFKTLSKQNLSGLILKVRSPSCGINNTVIFNRAGKAIATGSGLYAGYFQQQMPWLFFRDESQLINQQQCQNFITACQLSDDFQRGIEQHDFVLLKQHYGYLFAGEPALIIGEKKKALTLLKQRLEDIIEDFNSDDLSATLLRMKSEFSKQL